MLASKWKSTVDSLRWQVVHSLQVVCTAHCLDGLCYSLQDTDGMRDVTQPA